MKIHNNIINQSPQIGRLYYINVYSDRAHILPHTKTDIIEGKYYFGDEKERIFIYMENWKHYLLSGKIYLIKLV